MSQDTLLDYKTVDENAEDMFNKVVLNEIEQGSVLKQFIEDSEILEISKNHYSMEIEQEDLFNAILRQIEVLIDDYDYLSKMTDTSRITRETKFKEIIDGFQPKVTTQPL